MTPIERCCYEMAHLQQIPHVHCSCFSLYLLLVPGLASGSSLYLTDSWLPVFSETSLSSLAQMANFLLVPGLILMILSTHLRCSVLSSHLGYLDPGSNFSFLSFCFFVFSVRGNDLRFKKKYLSLFLDTNLKPNSHRNQTVQSHVLTLGPRLACIFNACGLSNGTES